jgi:hypothetical protein
MKTKNYFWLKKKKKKKNLQNNGFLIKLCLFVKIFKPFYKLYWCQNITCDFSVQIGSKYSLHSFSLFLIEGNL